MARLGEDTLADKALHLHVNASFSRLDALPTARGDVSQSSAKHVAGPARRWLKPTHWRSMEATENVGVENAIQSKLKEWKKQEYAVWKANRRINRVATQNVYFVKMYIKHLAFKSKFQRQATALAYHTLRTHCCLPSTGLAT